MGSLLKTVTKPGSPGNSRIIRWMWLEVFFINSLATAPALVHLISMQLFVYSSRWCPDCHEAKRFLAKHNIPFTEIDIETTPGAAEAIVERTGKRAIPQFVIDGEWVQPYRPGRGFLYEEMKTRLGINEPAQAND